MDERAEPPRRPDPDSGDVDRLQALEHQVRQLTSRLAGWVEAQLVQAVEDRRNDMKVLRSELQTVVNEQLAGMRAESASVLTVTTRRLEVAQEQLSERLDSVADRAAEAATSAMALAGSTSSETGRLELLEAQVDQRLARLNDEFLGRLRAATEHQRAELEAVRTELQGAAAQEAQRATGASAAADGLEQRVRSAMSRLSESVEAKLAEVTAGRGAELEELRAALAAATDALNERVDGVARQVSVAAEGMAALRTELDADASRAEALEQRVKAAVGRLTDSVESRLGEVGTAGQADLEALRKELQEVLAKQVSEARTEIGTIVSDAHRRFLISVEELDERMGAVARQAASAASGMELLKDTVGSDGRRIEALELHTRRTDARLTDLVEAKLSELASQRGAEFDELRTQVRGVLDDHLAETRAEVASALTEGRGELAAEVASALAEGRRELAEGRAELAAQAARLDDDRADLGAQAARLEERRAGLDRQAAEAVATLESLGASVDAALHEAEEHLAQTVEARLADLEALATQVAEARAEMTSSVASVSRRSTRAQDELRTRIDALSDKVEVVAAATAKAASTEAGMLAPLRSDVRKVQSQVAELGEALAELRPRKKPPAAPPKPSARSRAEAVAARKAAAPAKATKSAAKTAKAAKPATKAATAKKAKTAGTARTAKRPVAQ